MPSTIHISPRRFAHDSCIVASKYVLSLRLDQRCACCAGNVPKRVVGQAAREGGADDHRGLFMKIKGRDAGCSAVVLMKMSRFDNTGV